jgi:NDP-sugar pyrophosphorylase family protein
MQCLILAGGLATRMRPITETIPKALIPVCGVPFVDHQLRWMAAHGVTEAILSIGYRGDMLRDHVGDGARFGVAVRVVDEGMHLRGTAGALRLALDQGVLDDAFLVTYGDSFLPIDFARVWRAFAASGAPALMTVFHNAGRWDTSNAIYRDGRVELYDKRRQSRPAADFQFIDYGLLAMKRSVIAARVAPPRTHDAGGAIEKTDLAGVLNTLSIDGELAGMEIAERFYEIGSPAGLADFEAWMRAQA